MKPLMMRAICMFAVVLLSAVLLGAAVLVGRGNASPIAVIQTNEREPDLVTYVLVDVDRRIGTMHRRLPVPELVDTWWYMQPPLTLQRVTRSEFADWTLSVVDVRRNTMLPVLRLTTANNARIRIPDFLARQLPDGTTQYSVYVPHSGEIWTATPDKPNAALVAKVQRGLPYPLSLSPDGTILAVNGAGELTVMNSDGSNARAFDGLQSQAWVTWSPDGQKLLASPLDLYSRESARVIDVLRGELTVLDGARLAISCGAGYVAITEQANGFGVTSISEDGKSSAILDAETLNGLEPVGIIQLEEQSCESLLILNRRGEVLLVHPDSGDMTLLGHNTRPINADGDKLLYQTRASETVEVWQLEMKSGAQPELLGVYMHPFGEIGWLDGGNRGLSIDSGRLRLIERHGLSTIPLNGASAVAYSLLED
jgi:hypothetical protein